MNDIEEASGETVQAALEDQRSGGLDVYRTAVSEAQDRHSAVVTAIVEARDEIHKIEGRMHDDAKLLNGWKEHLSYQERRKAALERRIIANRAFLRSAEDEASGIIEP